VAGRKSFLLRVDATLLDAMQRWANDDLRSLNGQIEYMLREALRRSGRLPREPIPAPIESENAGSSTSAKAPADAAARNVTAEDPAYKRDDRSN
jgi:hypothetical protein